MPIELSFWAEKNYFGATLTQLPYLPERALRGLDAHAHDREAADQGVPRLHPQLPRALLERPPQPLAHAKGRAVERGRGQLS